MAMQRPGGQGRMLSHRLTRRDALAQMLLAAGVVAIGMRGAEAERAPASDRLSDLGMELSEAQRAAGAAFVERHATVDVHCHPGRFFLRNLPYETPTSRAFATSKN